MQDGDARFHGQFRINGEMKTIKQAGEKGAAGYILLWLLGIPIPVLLLFFLLRGCT